MQSITLTVTGEQTSAVRALDFFLNPFNVGLGAVVDGVVDYTVDFTFEDPTAAGFDPATADWFPIAALTAKTADVATALTTPCRGIRLTGNTGSVGTVVLYIQQAGTI